MKGLARFLLCSLVGILSYAGPVSATLIFDGFQDLTGTGLGAVNTVLTVQSPANSTDAQGCVGRLGGCPGGALNSTPSDPLRIIGGSFGGNELTGDAQTKTILGSTLGITSANDLRIVFNPSEPGSAAQRGIVLEDLRLTIYNPDGSVQFNSGGFSGFEIDDATGGVGQAGWFFKLDSAQAAAAGSIDANDRIGLSAAVSGADGAPETFFVTGVSGGVTGNGNGVGNGNGGLPPIPGPATLLLLGSGLAGIAILRYRTRNREV